jgi:ankyrin repeat protein
MSKELLDAITKNDVEKVTTILLRADIKYHINDVNYYDGYTPLTKAIKLGNSKIIKLLINNKNTNLDAPCREYRYEFTPLMYAAYTGNEEIVQLLISKNVRVDSVDRYNYNTALHVAKTAKIVNSLVAAGANIEAKNYANETPLIHCADKWFNAGAEALIAKGAKVDASDSAGRTALHYASTAELVNSLIAAGANIEAKSTYGLTPLMSCAAYGRSEGVDALLAKGAKTEIGFFVYGHDYIKNKYSNIVSVENAILHGDIEKVKKVLTENRVPGSQFPYDLRLLNHAIKCNKKEMVELLLNQENGKIDLSEKMNNKTPLERAIELGRYEIADLLIEKGAIFDINNSKEGQKGQDYIKKEKYVEYRAQKFAAEIIDLVGNVEGQVNLENIEPFTVKLKEKIENYTKRPLTVNQTDALKEKLVEIGSDAEKLQESQASRSTMTKIFDAIASIFTDSKEETFFKKATEQMKKLLEGGIQDNKGIKQQKQVAVVEQSTTLAQRAEGEELPKVIVTPIIEEQILETSDISASNFAKVPSVNPSYKEELEPGEMPSIQSVGIVEPQVAAMPVPSAPELEVIPVVKVTEIPVVQAQISPELQKFLAEQPGMQLEQAIKGLKAMEKNDIAVVESAPVVKGSWVEKVAPNRAPDPTKQK